MASRPVKSCFAGVVSGAVVSITPFELAVPLALGLFVFLRSPTSLHRPIAAASAIAIMSLAAILPIKHLDRSVGPMDYPSMPIQELVTELRNQWDFHILLGPYNPATLAAFRLSAPCSRREAIHQLAEQNRLSVRFRPCLSGSTLLFGRDTFAKLGPTIQEPQEE